MKASLLSTSLCTDLSKKPSSARSQGLGEGKMRRQSAQFDVDGDGAALLLAGIDHRIRDLLMTIEAAVKQTHSRSVEDCRAKLRAWITGLRNFCEFTRHYGCTLGLAQLLEQSTRLYSANGTQVMAAGPDVQLEPSLALVLHVLAANASKLGALSLPLGFVKVEWRVRHVPGVASKLAIDWVERGGPEVKGTRQAALGSQFMETVLHGYGRVQLDRNSSGLACFMLVDLDHADTRIKALRASRGHGGKPPSHSTRH
jgi:two-component sensor histidine kinase